MPEFMDTILGKRLDSAAGAANRMTIGLLGESHGDMHLAATVFHALCCHYPADVIMDYRTYAEGGQMFSIGGTQINNEGGLFDQLPQFAARPADIAMVAAGWNDVTAPQNPNTVIANLITAVESIFASGARFVLLFGITPGWSTNLNTSRSAAKLNRMIQQYARATPNVFFVDVWQALGNVYDSTKLYGYNAINTEAGAFTDDGVHWNSNGQRAVAPYIAEILKIIAPPRSLYPTAPLGNYDPVNGAYGNMLGNGGSMFGSSGTISGGGADNNVAGESASSRLTLYLGGTSVPSIVTNAKTGERRQKIELNQTGGLIQCVLTPTISNPNNGDATRKCDVQARLELENVTGITGVSMRVTVNGAEYTSPRFATTNVKSVNLDPITETHNLCFPYPLEVGTVANNPKVSVLVHGLAGQSVTGNLYLSRMSAVLV